MNVLVVIYDQEGKNINIITNVESVEGAIDRVLNRIHTNYYKEYSDEEFSELKDDWNISALEIKEDMYEILDGDD